MAEVLGQLYKITGPDGAPYHGGSGAWPLPKGDEPGAWREIEGDVIPCSNGLHLCRERDLLEWLGPVIWEAEHEGEAVVHENTKVVVRHARLVRHVGGWNKQTARLFAADCAERVLPIANDPRCDAAVLASRRYSFGLIDAAAWDAARDAASAAAHKWQERRLLDYLTGRVDLDAIRKSVEAKP